jgi:hypothetical protein
MLLLGCSIPVPPPSSPLVAPLGEIAHDPTLDTGTPLLPPAEEEEEAEDPLPPVPQVLFNEIAVSNRSLESGEFSDFPDYIELFNADTVPVKLSSLAIRDDDGAVWMGGDGFIEPGAYLKLYADDRDLLNHLPFELSSEGNPLVLLIDGQASDRFDGGEVEPDIVWARFPDGGSWAPTIIPTFGSSNGDSPSATLDPSDRLFQLDRKLEIEITLSSDSYHSLEVDRLTYVEGAVSIDGVPYSKVGVRLKAYVGSARSINQKCGFKIDLNYYEDYDYAGIKKLTLNNMVQDPSYIHEHLAYTLYEAMDVPSPRRAYAHVYVNSTYYGLYLLLETIDKQMLERWFADNSGALYEGAYGVDLYPGYEYSFEYDEGPDPTDRSDLTAVIDVLAQTPTNSMIAELEKLVDLDEVLMNRAVESLIYHWDGYTTSNNYRLYHDPTTDRFSMIPWGTDQTFVNAWYGPWSGGGYIWTRCLQNTACYERYNEKLLQVADTMESLDLVAEAEKLVDFLYDDINIDPRREFPMSTWQYYYDATIATIQTYPDTVRQQVPAP